METEVILAEFNKLSSTIDELKNEVFNLKVVCFKIAKAIRGINSKTTLFSNVESLPDDEFLDKCDEEDLARAKEQLTKERTENTEKFNKMLASLPDSDTLDKVDNTELELAKANAL